MSDLLQNVEINVSICYIKPRAKNSDHAPAVYCRRLSGLRRVRIIFFKSVISINLVEI